MTKRSTKASESMGSQIKRSKHWSLGLVESMNNSSAIIKEKNEIVVIKDKYPKAKIHYLILPRENISGIHNLNSDHLDLIKEFGKLFKELISDNPDTKLRAGFHAVPSMQRLHMHVISDDMVSPCLKTKIHWNSFTTKFFIPYEELLQELQEKGSVSKITHEMHKMLLAMPLKCHKCDFVPKTMPQLKEHLILHVNTIRDFKGH